MRRCSLERILRIAILLVSLFVVCPIAAAQTILDSDIGVDGDGVGLSLEMKTADQPEEYQSKDSRSKD